MWPDRVSNPGPLTYVSGALPTMLHGPARFCFETQAIYYSHTVKILKIGTPKIITCIVIVIQME